MPTLEEMSADIYNHGGWDYGSVASYTIQHGLESFNAAIVEIWHNLFPTIKD